MNKSIEQDATCIKVEQTMRKAYLHFQNIVAIDLSVNHVMFPWIRGEICLTTNTM